MTQSNDQLSKEQILEIVRACCKALDDRKAENLRVLHIGPKSSIADYFVIATGTSNPHLRALRTALEKALDEQGAPILGAQADQESGWIVVDAYEIIFHIFTRDMREHYSLESLWKDAEEVPTEEMLRAG